MSTSQHEHSQAGQQEVTERDVRSISTALRNGYPISKHGDSWVVSSTTSTQQIMTTHQRVIDYLVEHGIAVYTNNKRNAITAK